MMRFGLLGRKLSHSFSKDYFIEKFRRDGVQAEYELYEIRSVADFPALIQNQALTGLNVTIPFKQTIIPFLDSLSEEAKAIGAVNTISIHRSGKTLITKGYNTDASALELELRDFLSDFKGSALILGTGGAASAAVFVLKQLGIEFLQVSRLPMASNQIAYSNLDDSVIGHHKLIINATPVGMYPFAEEIPDIPWKGIGANHFLFDLVYNPAITRFIQKGSENGAKVGNGLGMLHLQADFAWKLWKGQLPDTH